MRYKKNSPEDLRNQAEKILKAAAEKGVDESFFFVTTFQRYRTQIEILTMLQEEINKAGSMLVEKTYSGGKTNIYLHPSIDGFNKTSTAANQTVTTLLKVIDGLGKANEEEEEDEFTRFMRERA